MKLFIDDIRDPKLSMDWHTIKTITAAIRCLAVYKPSVVSIDHDISGYPQEDFTAVAWAIAAMPAEDRPKRVIIHTGNPVGAGRLHDILKDKVEIDVRAFLSERYYEEMEEK
jgi:hypothetical protein